MFNTLIDELESAEVPVLFNARLGESEWGLDGQFEDPSDDDENCGRIRIFREHAEIPGDPLKELLTLAHEAGHFDSETRGLRTASYKIVSAEVMPLTECALSSEERVLILEEEIRAWEFARARLEKVGFSDWRSFSQRVELSLGNYREYLALERTD